jgi:hypothetical protein
MNKLDQIINYFMKWYLILKSKNNKKLNINSHLLSIQLD